MAFPSLKLGLANNAGPSERLRRKALVPNVKTTVFAIALCWLKCQASSPSIYSSGALIRIGGTNIELQVNHTIASVRHGPPPG